MSSPEPKHNRITNAEDYNVKPVFWQTHCCTFFFILVYNVSFISFVVVCRFTMTANVRGLAKYGNRCLSSPEQMLIEKLLMKITTKS